MQFLIHPANHTLEKLNLILQIADAGTGDKLFQNSLLPLRKPIELRLKLGFQGAVIFNCTIFSYTSTGKSGSEKCGTFFAICNAQIQNVTDIIEAHRRQVREAVPDSAQRIDLLIII